MHLIANCLEDISRFASGQTNLEYTVEEMVRGLDFREQINRRDNAEKQLKQVKKILLPELAQNESYGYDGTEFIGDVYQIYRTILYQLATDRNLDNVYCSPALPSGNLGTIKIERI